MSERREVPRYVAEFAGQVSQPPGGPSLRVKVANLSIMGCCLQGAKSIKVHEACELKIEWEGKEFHAQADVIWKSGEAEVGLRFREVDEASQALVRKICANLLLEPPSPH